MTRKTEKKTSAGEAPLAGRRVLLVGPRLADMAAEPLKGAATETVGLERLVGRDPAHLFKRAKERRDLIAERQLERLLDLLLDRGEVLRTRLENDVPARDEGLDFRKAEVFDFFTRELAEVAGVTTGDAKSKWTHAPP